MQSIAELNDLIYAEVKLVRDKFGISKRNLNRKIEKNQRRPTIQQKK